MSDIETVQTEPVDAAQQEAVREMVERGVFYGRTKSLTHPRMKPFILHNRNGVEIINVNRTYEMLKSALLLVGERALRGQVLLVVTQPPFEAAARAAAEDFGVPLVTRRWLGGTLTNFKVISRRIEYFKKLKKDMASGALDKYTKKERARIDHQINRLQELLGGMENLHGMPSLLLVVDPQPHMTAIREARQMNIPVIALTNVDTDPDLVTHPVLGNTKSRASVEWFLSKFGDVFAAAKVAAANAEAEALRAAQAVGQ